jgi:thiol-disulfide isomerase/thioredoxin
MLAKGWFKKVILCFLCFQSIIVLGQKQFSVNVTLPKNFDFERLEAYFNDGRSLEKVKVVPQSKHSVLIKGEYYSLYVSVNLLYKKDSSETSDIYGSWFFLQDRPGSIIFYQNDTTRSPFEKYSLKNVKDFKIEQEAMAIYDSAVRREAIEYEEKYWDKIFSGIDNDTAIKNYYFNVLRKAQARKRLEYIINNSNSYYSFYTFRTDIAWPRNLPADTLIDILNNTFPDSFKFSDEGNYLKELLYGRLGKREDSSPIDFSVKDVNGQTVVLSKFRNQKYVLLHFWATWCSPCLKELPLLKQISNKYNLDDLQIISIAYKSTKFSDFVNTTKKYDMNWINIYNNLDLVNKYGNYPVPRICLIDKSGRMIYDTYELEKVDFQLIQLDQMLDKLVKGDPVN